MATCPRNKGNLPDARSDFLNWRERDLVRQAVFDRDAPFCVWCAEEVGDHLSDSYYTVDHVETRMAGGPYMSENLVLACKACNLDRGSLSILQYMMKRAARLGEREGFISQSC